MKCKETWAASGANVHAVGRKAWAGGFDGRAADRSSLRVVLLFRDSAIAMPPSGPSLLNSSLRTRRRQGEKGKWSERACCGTVRHGWVRWQGSRPERLEGRIALQGLGERHASLRAEVVEQEAAHTAKAGWEGPVQRAWDLLEQDSQPFPLVRGPA